MTAKIEFIFPTYRHKGRPTVATIGFFDGVHRGHLFLIEQVIQQAKEEDMVSAVITLDTHPRAVFHPESPTPLLSTFDDKIKRLSASGIDKLFILHFDKTTASLSAKEFMKQILKEQLNVQKLIIGYDNKFGHDPTDDFNSYATYGKELGIQVILNKEFAPNEAHISSSAIRKHIKNGDINLANKYLGYTYSISGKIINGYQNGRKIGFPTANLDPQSCPQLIPHEGVYATQINIEGHVETFYGMTNIGTRPTLNGNTLSIETHILNFQGDLYGKSLRISFIQYIRKEKKFSSFDALMHQLEKDKANIRTLFGI